MLEDDMRDAGREQTWLLKPSGGPPGGAAYRKFAVDGQHDAGLVIVSGKAVHWRIDYRACDFRSPSPDPSDPEQTIRILIVELAVE